MAAKRPLPFQRITIIGVGLIGGSLALAIKHRFPSLHITGVDTPRVLKRAVERNAVDTAERSLERALRFADLIIIAAPVSGIAKLLPRVALFAPAHAIITDTGSVKRSLTEQAQKLFPRGNFIGGHPMTGAEFSGIDAAHPLLFQNAMYILTPARTTNKQSIRRLAEFFTLLDARIVLMDAAVHDSVMAAVSHLPQLAAVALMNTAGKHHPDASAYLALSAGGFRDMTRIASSPFGMWSDILTANQKEIGKVLNLYITHLKKIASLVQSGPSQLADEFRTSKKMRSRIPRSMKGFRTPLVDLSVFVEDKAGELARLTTALADRGINIKDIELLKVREGRGGTFRLSFEDRSTAVEAARTLQQAGFDVGGK